MLSFIGASARYRWNDGQEGAEPLKPRMRRDLVELSAWIASGRATIFGRSSATLLSRAKRVHAQIVYRKRRPSRLLHWGNAGAGGSHRWWLVATVATEMFCDISHSPTIDKV